MSIVRIRPEDIETFSLETNPARTFSSSSTGGASGVVYLFPRRSSIEKEVVPNSLFSSSLYHDTDLNSLLSVAKRNRRENGNNYGVVGQYLESVNSQSVSPRKQQTLEIIRFTPGVSFNKDTTAKKVVTEVLMPHYRCTYPNAHFNFTNYHCLNFFTSSTVPTSSVLLYPQAVTIGSNNTLSGAYFTPDGFTFDFWINPKYTTDRDGLAFKAGTLFHLSSSYAVSLITGSHKDQDGKPDRYRILLQLSNSAGTPPSQINTASLPTLAFLSEDNSLARDAWHHVSIRWGTSTRNSGTGSFIINGANSGSFVIPSSSVSPLSFSGTNGQPSVLCVGNFFEGPNQSVSNLQALYFNAPVATKEGVLELIDTTSTTHKDRPAIGSFTHPLNAEVHELKIFSRYLSDTEISAYDGGGATLDTPGLLFYLPPMFTRESPTRTWEPTLAAGGVLMTPFFEEDGTTVHPFNVDMSFDVAGHYMNLENYVRDFATGQYPVLWELSASAITVPTNLPRSANELLYNTGSVRRRALTILPCDNGNVTPNFNLLATLSTSSFVTDIGGLELGSISLRNMYPTSSILVGQYNDSSGSILRQLSGPDPADSSSLGHAPGVVPTILQRTRDNTSNQVVFFDISQLFYGNSIDPGSVVLYDTNMSGSGGKVRMTLRDNGRGNLYRADATGSWATWNSVGSVFYNEGIIMLKNPSLYFFGQDAFTISFKGQQNLHVMSLACTAAPLMETSSSNPSYLPVSASNMASDQDKKFVYVTDLYIHDDNLNVIAKTKLAQPVVKRTGDKLVFKFKMDY